MRLLVAVVILAFGGKGKPQSERDTLAELEVDWCRPPMMYFNHPGGKSGRCAVVPPPQLPFPRRCRTVMNHIKMKMNTKSTFHVYRYGKRAAATTQ